MVAGPDLGLLQTLYDSFRVTGLLSTRQPGARPGSGLLKTLGWGTLHKGACPRRLRLWTESGTDHDRQTGKEAWLGVWTDVDTRINPL